MPEWKPVGFLGVIPLGFMTIRNVFSSRLRVTPDGDHRDTVQSDLATMVDGRLGRGIKGVISGE